MRLLFIFALLVRLSSIFVIQTSYVPDETWQCTEVAHKLVFGNGHLTWEWDAGLRSYLHPLLFTLPYMLLKVLGLDTPQLVILLPRLFQALITFAGDLLLYRLVVKLYGHSQATYVLVMQLTSWYLYYVSPRPLINNLETFLITATLNLWPTRYSDIVTYPAIVLAALSVALRPTLILFWGFLGVHYLISSPEKRVSSIVKSVAIGLPTLALTVLLDSYIYGKPVVVFYNFLKFNLSGSAVYGAHPWYWYLTQGLPAILGTHLIFIALAFYKERDYPRQFLGVAGVTLLFFSLIAHKEFRFIQHLTPIFMLWAGLGLHWLSRHLQRSSLYLLIMVHCLINVLVAFYLGFFHQRGTITAIHDLAHAVTPHDHLVFLTPCHATPLHSHLHNAHVTLRFLDCSPGLGRHEEARFFEAPVRWWEGYVGGRTVGAGAREWVVLFDEGVDGVQEQLRNSGYKVFKKHFYAHLLVDDKLGRHILIYKKTF